MQVKLYSTDHSKKVFRFRFENMWLQEKTFHEEVAQFWRLLTHIHLMPKLLELSSFMGNWGHKFFNKFREKIQKQKTLMSTYEDCLDDERTKRYFEERGKLDEEDMCNMVREYFVSVFSQSGRSQEESVDLNNTVITEDQNRHLTAEFKKKEFSVAIMQMHLDKSAGPDGLNPAFFQKFWKLLGDEIFQCRIKWLQDVSFPANLNDTILVLIPKKDQADSMKYMRLIALCNVLYKVIAKVLSNILKIIPRIDFREPVRVHSRKEYN